MKVNLTKTLSGLIPADPESEEWYLKIKPGDVIHADFKKCRNYKFMQKYFALLKIAFENWNPGEINSKYGVPLKNFDRFRKDISILCGFFNIVIRLDGTSRPEAHSISFAKMTEEEFAVLYSKTIDVCLKRIYGNNLSADELDVIVEQYLGFC